MIIQMDGMARGRKNHPGDLLGRRPAWGLKNVR
jgi:hypothetical protein